MRLTFIIWAMGSYNKIILFVMMLPLFTASIAVGGLQTAYGGEAPVSCNDNDDCIGGSDCRIDTCVGGFCELVEANVGVPCGDQSSGVCDDPDTCNDEGKCRDNFRSSTTECRADAGVCDVVEFCDGAGSCPADEFEPASTACGDGSDTICDNPNTCDGAGTCNDNNEPANTECRADAGACDVAELCDGAGSCPADEFEPASTTCTCNVGPGECDGSNTCIGFVLIDVKPGSDPNSINPKSMGLVPVAILGSDTLDVTTVDYANIEFGTSGAMPVHAALEDVNDDGFTDLVLQFIQKETGIAKGDVEACISGDTLGGQPFLGCDAIKTLGK